MSKNTCNEAVRRALRVKNMAVWQLADLLGVSDNTLFRKLRHELPEEEQKKMINLIENAKGG